MSNNLLKIIKMIPKIIIHLKEGDIQAIYSNCNIEYVLAIENHESKISVSYEPWEADAVFPDLDLSNAKNYIV